MLLPILTTALAVTGEAAAQAPIRVGQTVQGSLSDSDARMGRGVPYDCYLLQTERGRGYRVTLGSLDFTTVLGIGRGRDCRTAEPGPYRADITGDGGVWTIVATSFGSSARGDYSLEVEENADGPARPLATIGSISLGQSIDGAFTANDAKRVDAYLDCYAFEGRRGQHIEVELSTGVSLSGAQLVSGGDCNLYNHIRWSNSVGDRELLDAVLPSHGRYSITVAGTLGPYRLTLRPYIAPAPVAPLVEEACAPAECPDRYGHLRSGLERTGTRNANLESQLNAYHWGRLPQSTTYARYSDTARNALQAAEDSVFNLANVARDSLRDALREASADIVTHLDRREARAYFSAAAVRRVRQRRLADRLSAASLRYGREYVENRTSGLKIGEPQTSQAVHRANSYNAYHQVCGANGLTPATFNAKFAEYGSDPANVLRTTYVGPGTDGVVPCPGLIIDMGDFSDEEGELADAFRFHAGAELGRIIIDEMSDVWSPGQQMAACFGDAVAFDEAAWPAALPGRPAGQIKLDMTRACWGTVVLAARLAEVESMETRTRVMALALVSDCGRATDVPGRAEYRLLLTALAQVPALADALPGAAPSPERPYCAAALT